MKNLLITFLVFLLLAGSISAETKKQSDSVSVEETESQNVVTKENVNFGKTVFNTAITFITAPIWIPASIIIHKTAKDYFSSFR